MRSTEQDEHEAMEQLGGFVRCQETLDSSGPHSPRPAEVRTCQGTNSRRNQAQYDLTAGRGGRSCTFFHPVRSEARPAGSGRQRRWSLLEVLAISQTGTTCSQNHPRAILAVTAWGIFPSRLALEGTLAAVARLTQPRPTSPPPLPFSNFCRPIFPGVCRQTSFFPVS